MHPRPPIKCLHHDSETTPNASPRPCRDACLACASHSAPPHRRRLHVQAGTGLAPTRPDKMPAPRFRYSPNANPRPCRAACLARAAQNAPPHRRRLHVQAGTGLATTPPDKMPAPRFRYSPECKSATMSRCVLSTCIPQRTAAQETPARTGRYWPCTTPTDKMRASRFR